MPNYYRLLHYILFLLFLCQESMAQERFIPPYAFFPNDTIVLSDSAKTYLLANGAQYRNYKNLPLANPAPEVKIKDTTTFAAVISSADVLIISEKEAPFEARAFMVLNTAQLAKQGYTHFLFDMPNDSFFFPKTRAFPLLPDNKATMGQYGHLIKEPLFASIIREARKSKINTAGLLPVAGASSEISQYLKNRIAAIRAADNNAKIVVYLTGNIINTEALKSTIPDNTKLRISVLDIYDSGKSQTFTKNDSLLKQCNTYNIYKGDSIYMSNGLVKRYALLSNFRCFYTQRPYIVSEFSGRVYQNSNVAKNGLKSCPCIVAMYRLEELRYKSRAIPFDVVQAETIDEKALLSLAKGQYFLYAWNKAGELITVYFEALMNQ